MAPKDFDSSSLVHLNVGGKVFCTSVDTLTQREPDSMLAAMFSGRHALCQEKGYVFIDRDGKYFGYILNWLRDGEVPTLEDFKYPQLLREAEFFQLLGLAYEVNVVLNKRKSKGLCSDLTRADIIKSYIPLDKNAWSDERYILRGVNLSGLDLSNLDMSNFSFCKATIRNVCFSGALLKKAKFNHVDAEGAIFDHANLDHSSYYCANLQGASFASADLGGANLRGANLENADLTNANLEGAKLVHANLKNANLTNAKLEGARGVTLPID